MLEKKEYKVLRELIKAETKDMSIDEVAEKCNLPKEKIRSLLEEEKISEPSTEIIERIALAFPLIRGEKLFYEINYYFPEVEKVKTIGLFPTIFLNMTDDNGIIEYMGEKINEGFKRLAMEGKAWDNKGELFDEFFDRFGTGVKCIKIFKDVSENPYDKENGEFVISCCLYWEYRLDEKTKRRSGMHFILYCNKTEDGKLILTDVSTEGDRLLNTKSLPDVLEELFSDKNLDSSKIGNLTYSEDCPCEEYLKAGDWSK